MSPVRFASAASLNQGSPFSMPRAWASLDLATTQPSLLERTTTGFSLQLWDEGALTRHAELTSMSAVRSTRPSGSSFIASPASHLTEKSSLEAMEAAGNNAPDAQLSKLRDNHVGIVRIFGGQPLTLPCSSRSL